MTRGRAMSATGIAIVGGVLSLGLAGCGGDEDTPAEPQLSTEVEEVLSDCPVPDQAVGDAVGAEVDSSTSTSSGALPDANGEFAVTYSGCTYLIAGGGSFDIAEVVDAEGNPDPAGFDTIAAEDGAEPVQGIGDEAVAFEDEILFLAGDNAYAVSGQDKDYEPAEPATVEALAEATAQEVSG